MRKLASTIVLSTFLAAGATAVPAAAQDAPPAAGPFIGAQTQNEYLAKDQLIGAKVLGKDGKIIGDIEDLILDDASRVIGVVMGTGGFMGLAEKKIGVALSALDFDEKDGKSTVSFPAGTPEALESAPAFQRTKPKKTIMERAKEKAQELTDKTTATTQQAIDKAKPQLETAKEKAVEAYEAAKEAAQPTIDKAKEAAEEAKKAVEETYEAAKEAAKDLVPEDSGATPAPAPEASPAPAPEAAAPAPAAEPAPAPSAEGSTPAPAADSAPAPAPEAPAADAPASDQP